MLFFKTMQYLLKKNNNFKNINNMACGCKNKQRTSGNPVQTVSPSKQESAPEKKGNTIIKREIK